MPHYSLDYSDEFYITVVLELESEHGGLLKATIHYPAGNLYAQDHIDLSEVIRASHYIDRGIWAASIPDAKPESQENRLKTQQLIGDTLSKAIFVGNLFSFINDLATIAHDRIILLTVFYPSGPLDDIPWELLGNPSIEFTKKHNLSISVSRGIFYQDPKSPKGQGRVKIAYITSQSNLYPGFHAELSAISKTIGSNQKLELVTYQGTDITYENFRKFLRETKPHILHMVLYGESGKLLFSRESHDEPISVRTLIREISEINSVSVAIFNISLGAGEVDHDLLLPTLARQLVESGIPCAIALFTPITDRAAVEFSEWLYMGFAEYKSVRQAYHAATATLRHWDKQGGFFWSVPKLYVNLDVNPLTRAPKDKDFGSLATGQVSDFIVKDNNPVNQPAEIFISYARADVDTVQGVYKSLLKDHRPWMDIHSIIGGENWLRAINRAIDECEIFLAILSNNSVSRRGVIQKELKKALDKWEGMLPDDIYILPLRIDDCPIPDFLQDIQAIDWEKGRGRKKLLAAIRVALARRKGS